MCQSGSCVAVVNSSLLNLRHTCDNPAATEELACRLAKELLSADQFPVLILLCGKLGVGKTVFSRGIARGLGIDEPILSPTFPILLEYRGKVPLYHFDLYRLSDSEEFDLLGGEEILFSGGTYGPGLSLIEWPERLKWLPALPCFQVDLHMGVDCEEREVNIRQLN